MISSWTLQPYHGVGSTCKWNYLTLVQKTLAPLNATDYYMPGQFKTLTQQTIWRLDSCWTNFCLSCKCVQHHINLVRFAKIPLTDRNCEYISQHTCYSCVRNRQIGHASFVVAALHIISNMPGMNQEEGICPKNKTDHQKDEDSLHNNQRKHHPLSLKMTSFMKWKRNTVVRWRRTWWEVDTLERTEHTTHAPNIWDTCQRRWRESVNTCTSHFVR